MISKGCIDSILDSYDIKDNSDVTIATIASHTAQQIVMGAKRKKFKTALIVRPNKIERYPYDGFSACKPDEYLEVDNYKEILSEAFQQKLRNMNTIVIPHGSFVAYVGAEALSNRFKVPMLGNRITLTWETSREKQRTWLQAAGLNLPRQYKSVEDIPYGQKGCPKLFFVKYSGAPGGKGFFDFNEKDEFLQTILLAKHKKELGPKDIVTIQEYIPGNRHYLHFYPTPFFKKGLKVKNGSWLELLSEDRRDETADELPRVGKDYSTLKKLGITPDYEVSGNLLLVLREKYLGPAMEMGRKTVLAADKLMGGITGPFCLETVLNKGKFYVFEISARIVAGTNIYTAECPHPYTVKTWGVGMSHGDRIALEIQEAIKRKRMPDIIY